MSNSFKFTELFGLDSPFDEPVLESNNHYWTGDIDIPKLIGIIKNNSPFKINNYEAFFKGKQIKIGGNRFKSNRFKEYLLGVNKNVPIGTYFNEKSRIPLIVNRENLYFNGYITNTTNMPTSSISKTRVQFGASIHIETQSYYYRILLPFTGETGNSIFEKFGVIIETNDYYDFESLINYLGFQIPEDFKRDVFQIFEEAFANAKGDCNVIDAIYEFAPDFVLQMRDDLSLWKDLVSLSKCGIDRETIFTGSDESVAVLNILLNFSSTAYVFNQFSKYPELVDTLLLKIDNEYVLDFLRALSIIGMENWTLKDIDNALFYIAEPKTYLIIDEDGAFIKVFGWCGYNEKRRTYEVGVTQHTFEPGDIDASKTKITYYGDVNAMGPVGTRFQGERLYIPAIAAVYFTLEEFLDTRINIISNFLDVIIAAPSSVIKVAATTAKTVKIARAITVRSRIAQKYKEALQRLQIRIKPIVKKVAKITDDFIPAQKHLEDFTKLRPAFQDLDKVSRLWELKVTQKLFYTNQLKKFYLKHLKEFPGLKGRNQAEFVTKIFNKGKKVGDDIVEFSVSGKKEKLIEGFGNPPKLPPNTIDVLEDYTNFQKFAKGAIDFNNRSRRFDSEIKYIFNFLKNHINKGDEFIIETRNIFSTCGSCQKEFLMLEAYLNSLGKKVKIIVTSDISITRTSELLKKLKIKK